ncbi:ATPase [Spirochaetia bacterium]|nr:ATPase [Spirochaetia bacterium]
MDETFYQYIPRNSYIERIRPFMRSHIIKVLVGQRRVGKSYILFQLMDEIKKDDGEANLVYINTELVEFRDLKTHVDLYDFVAAHLVAGKPNYVFIDEIQEIAEFERAVKSLFAEDRADLYITGSNSHLLSGNLAPFLAGRYIQFQIHPLGYGEFLTFHRLEDNGESLRKYLRIGGMPYLASMPDSENQAFEYLKNMYESILLRDVVARENIRNIRFIENLTAYLADNTGNICSANIISKYLKNQRNAMPVQTVISYLTALEKSFLINKVHRRETAGLKIFEIGEKYYFEDMGLRNILTRNALPQDTGKLVECAVYLFLVQQGFTVYVGKDGDAEIDFIAEKQDERIYVQAAWRVDNEQTYAREFGNLEAIKDNYPKYVVTLDEDIMNKNPQGIRHVSLREFLLWDL